MESQHFIFNGINSQDMNLHNVRINDSGFIQTPFWGKRDIQETTTVKRLTPYHCGVSKRPIEFELQFALLDEYNRPRKWTPEERFNIAEWLLHDGYKSFQTIDDLSKIYYVVCISEGNLNLMNTEGYIELTFRTNSPYAWSVVDSKTFDLSDNDTTEIITLYNNSNVVDKYKPKIEIELVEGETNVNLKNLSNSNREFKFEDLIANEIISIDNENEIILSNKFGSNPFSKFNEKWLELARGANQIEVTGKCKITVVSQYPIAQ